MVQHMIENLSGFLRPLALELDAVGLAVDGVGELVQGGPGAAAGVEQAHGLSGR